MPREAQNATPTMRRVPVTKSFGKEVKEGCGTQVGIIGQILLPCRPPVEPVAKWPWWVCDATRRGGV